MNVLQNILDNAQSPILVAFLLGLMTAISPCPLTTNITALGYISKEIENRRNIIVNGLLYTLGRALSYTILGILLFIGASKFQIARFFQLNSEKYFGILLIIIGFLMLDIITLRLPWFNKVINSFTSNLKAGTRLSALLMGILFALAFCPYSGVLYFGMLIPMTIASVKGLYLPLIFALATGLPVIIFSWLIGYSVSGIGKVYNKVTTFQKWFNRVVAVLFIIVGIYNVYKYYIAG